MLIEVHIIRNHSPATPNCGDRRTPKACLFGGVRRARISSQCLKRSIRRSVALQTAMGERGVCTSSSLAPEALEECLGGRAAPSTALCGRSAKGGAAGPCRTVGSHVAPALSAAHAISTHEVITEANSSVVEGLQTSGGAGNSRDARCVSVCFYEYLCVGWRQLVENLDGDAELAKRTVRRFLYAAATSTPPGRQSSFAPFSLPEGILVEVKREPAVPMSYVSAFADPVPREARRGLTGESIARLGEHVRDMASGYGIAAERFWFSPSRRHPLTGVDDLTERAAADGIESTGSLPILVDAVVEAVEAQACAARGSVTATASAPAQRDRSPRAGSGQRPPLPCRG